MFDMRLEQIAKYCRILLDNPKAEEHKNYLNSRITDIMQEKFYFGYFPGIENINLLSDLIGMNTLKELGLLFSKEIKDSSGPRTLYFNYFEDQQLIMPYKDVYGNIVALVGRSLLNDKEREEKQIDKYKNTKFIKGHHLFGLYEAKDEIINTDFVYVVEGQFDVIKAHQKGLSNIVALGSSNMTGYQLSLLCRYTNNIYLLLDNDMAGLKGRREIEKKYSEFANIKNIYLPDGYKDLDEYLNTNDTKSLTLLLNNNE